MSAGTARPPAEAGGSLRVKHTDSAARDLSAAGPAPLRPQGRSQGPTVLRPDWGAVRSTEQSQQVWTSEETLAPAPVNSSSWCSREDRPQSHTEGDLRTPPEGSILRALLGEAPRCTQCSTAERILRKGRSKSGERGVHRLTEQEAGSPPGCAPLAKDSCEGGPGP